MEWWETSGCANKTARIVTCDRKKRGGELRGVFGIVLAREKGRARVTLFIQFWHILLVVVKVMAADQAFLPHFWCVSFLLSFVSFCDIYWRLSLYFSVISSTDDRSTEQSIRSGEPILLVAGRSCDGDSRTKKWQQPEPRRRSGFVYLDEQSPRTGWILTGMFSRLPASPRRRTDRSRNLPTRHQRPMGFPRVSQLGRCCQ